MMIQQLWREHSARREVPGDQQSLRMPGDESFERHKLLVYLLRRLFSAIGDPITFVMWNATQITPTVGSSSV